MVRVHGYGYGYGYGHDGCDRPLWIFRVLLGLLHSWVSLPPRDGRRSSHFENGPFAYLQTLGRVRALTWPA